MDGVIQGKVIMRFRAGLLQLWAAVIVAALICLPIGTQCSSVFVGHDDLSLSAMSHAEPISAVGHAHNDPAKDHHLVTSAKSKPSGCCDRLTCDVTSCASVLGGNILSVAVPKLQKNCAVFASAFTEMPAQLLTVLYKPPINA